MNSHYNPRFNYNSFRRKTRKIHIGSVVVGGDAPVSVQSMTKTDTRDTKATVDQIKTLEKMGCEIIRCAVPDNEAVEALGRIKNEVSIPVIADIHFDHKLALAAVAQGVDGLRINPGNIGSLKKVKEVVAAARDMGIPIRIGVNAGSLESDLQDEYGGATSEAMVASALRHIRILEDMNFTSIKVSLKASDVFRTLEAYEGLATEVDYPFHVGITESGTFLSGTVKSSVGLGLLLHKGLADTIRVSLTAPPEDEVRIGQMILRSLNIRQQGPEIVSCPTCGRCEVDLMKIAGKVEQELSTLKDPIHVAVMGCMVNGPGEAKEADIGVACGRGVGIIFKGGKILKRVKEERIVEEFVREVFSTAEENRSDSSQDDTS